MFVDVVVIAGIGTVGLMVAFLAGFGYFIWKDSHKVKVKAIAKTKQG
ncbi:MAG: cytochrome c oxidase subunit CcoM [Pseudomonas sp.]|nr:cytochrome c oxidase subunit CcoM [Pseudomonas sp.]